MKPSSKLTANAMRRDAVNRHSQVLETKSNFHAKNGQSSALFKKKGNAL